MKQINYPKMAKQSKFILMNADFKIILQRLETEKIINFKWLSQAIIQTQ